MQKIKIIILIISVSFSVSCIDIKSDYPDINYYDIRASDIKADNSYPVSLQVKDMHITSVYNTDQIIIKKPNGLIDKYYYHRWATDPSELMTDKVMNILSKSELFGQGVFSSSSVLVPDYLLEGKLLEISAENYEEKEEYNAFIEIQFSLIKRTKNKVADTFIFTKIYNSRVAREEEEIEYLFTPMGKALSDISKQLIRDLDKTLQEK